MAARANEKMVGVPLHGLEVYLHIDGNKYMLGTFLASDSWEGLQCYNRMQAAGGGKIIVVAGAGADFVSTLFQHMFTIESGERELHVVAASPDVIADVQVIRERAKVERDKFACICHCAAWRCHKFTMSVLGATEADSVCSCGHTKQCHIKQEGSSDGSDK